MQSVDMQELTTNPAEAIRKSHDSPVIVTENDRPEAILMHLNQSDIGGNGGLGLALAVALYRDGAISLARAAHLASVSISEMTTHLSRLGIPIAGGDLADSQSDIEMLEQWLASS